MGTTRRLAILWLTLTGAPGAVAQESPEPPMAAIRPTNLELHGQVRVDEYFWLRERASPDVIAYLEAENRYTAAMTEHLEPLRARLFEEIKGRIKQDDSSVPYRIDDWLYYVRFEDGKQYPIFARKRNALEAPEQIMLDANVEAEGHGYFHARADVVSPDHRVLAWATDTAGRRFYTIRFRDLTTGETYPDVIPNVTNNLVWANDSRTLFYTRQDPVTLRWHQVWRHRLGTDAAEDVLVYEEADDTFSTWVFRTKSRQNLMIASWQTLSSEYRYLAADDPEGAFRVVLPREGKHEYEADHFGDWFYIRSNDGARNFRLMRAPVAAVSKETWEEVIPHRDDVLLEGFEVFRDHLVVTERKGGLVRLRVRPWADAQAEHYIDFGEPAYSAWLQDNRELDTSVLRYGYSSMTTPNSVYDYDMTTREKTLMKRDEILGGFDVADYATERIQAPARDGTRVPVSIVYRKDLFRQSGTAPLLLYGYGSYGYSIDAAFDPARVSLLDRGFVFGIAHIRGGQELGRQWYDDGKLLKKKNTFTDFIDVAEHLVAEGYADPERLYAWGGSAGGLLMGAVMNLRPDLFHGIVAKVPYVDVVTTMLDETIPLTTSEFDEWGDPKDLASYEYMLSYSPYDNVQAMAYPNLLVTTSLDDSQVQYWEPAKWVARLRARKTDGNLLLLKTNMQAGHGGASGRYERYRETAFEYAFLLELAGLAESETVSRR
jgi:oligopeptidase B